MDTKISTKVKIFAMFVLGLNKYYYCCKNITQFLNKLKNVSSLMLILLILFAQSSNAQTTRTVGVSGANYSTLKLAFDAINAGTITGSITLQIIDNTTETATAVLNASGTGSASYSSITIYPTVTGKSISGNLASPFIDLSGADNVTIDGRLNASGSTKDLVITNTNTGTLSSTIRFINSAENNTIKYCNIKGSGTGAAAGIVYFSTSSAGNGNDNNLIDNNNITSDAAGRPINAIYSVGTSGRDNSGNTISNNSIYDVWLTSASSYSIQIGNYTSAWTISGNSFYETTTFVPTRGWTYNSIRISNTSGVGFVVSGNYIGGQAVQCGGSAFTVTNSDTTHLFNGIYINVGTTTTTSVQNNTIKNFNYTSKSTSPWQAIYVAAGNVNIGTTSGNTIGSVTSTGSVTVTGSLTATTVYGINIVSTGVVDCRNNTIGSVTTSNASTNASNFYGIYKSGTGTSTIINNIIGSTTTANSINASSNSTGNAQSVYGIYSAGSGIVTINSNTIANLTNSTNNTTAATAGAINGISSTSGTNTISNNTIRDLTIANANTSATQTGSVTGIALTGATLKTVSGNTIYNLSNTYASFGGSVVGLYFTGISTGGNTASGNFIYNLTCNVSSTAAKVYGIKIAAGTTTYSNNIINLGGNTATTIYGIYETGAASNNNSLYFNTVYIGGSLNSGITNKSYSLFSNVSTNTRDFRNNIFYNARSTVSGSSLHYAAYFNFAVNTALTLDYNDYFATGTGGVIGYYIGNKTVLPIVTGMDALSLAINPNFATPGGTSANDYITSASLPGVSGTGITTDFNGLTRSATPGMGALENNDYVWNGSASTDYNTAGNWEHGVVPPSGADISFSANPSNQCVLDQNRTIGNITNAQGTDQLVVNGKQLTITGNLNLTNGAKIDASANLSVVVFAGASAQSIPSGAFVSNTIDGLTINNLNGLTQNGDLIITQTLTLTTGAFSVGANTVTLNGSIAVTSGTITGGSSTNLSIGGSGASTNLPAIILNNLTLNRANGISLAGNVNVAGTLALSAGTLTVGANTITISGNSPTLASGNIDASNASATLIFANTSAMTLPATVFTGNVNNLTITGAGGITAVTDFTINGVLSLQNSNPASTKGILDMWNGSSLKTLTMGANATTIGIGEVTGIIKRTTIITGVTYTFGNQYMSANFSDFGTLPTEMSAKVIIGNTPSWRAGAINREIEIVQSGGSGTKAVFSFHYQDAELNGNDETKLVFWSKYLGGLEYGRSAYNTSENWIILTNVNVAFFSSSWDATKNITLDEFSTTSTLTWNGSLSDSWTSVENWTPNAGPSSVKNIIIPNASTTLNSPTLPAFTEVKSIMIDAGGVLNSAANAQLTLNGNGGAWINVGGTFNPNTSNVIFTNADATISGIANFYNVTINNGAVLWLSSGSTMRIAGAVTNNGAWRTVIGGPTTVEYNGGNQTVVVPNPSTNRYSTLILSGSGTKTMPNTALNIEGDFTIAGTTTVSALSSLSIYGNTTINSGSTFNTGNFDHSLKGNFENNGTFIAVAGKTINMVGTLTQSILGSGTTNFDKLTVNNSNGVTLYSNISINNTLTLTSGNLSVQTSNLEINGTINKTSGFIEVSPTFSLSFGGTDAITLTSDLFTTLPSINNLTINRTNSVTLGQDLTVNGILTLTNGLIILGDKNLTLGSSATIEGSPSASSMIVATSTGELRKIINDERTLPVSFTFPVGDNSGSAEYSPVTLNFTSGTFNNAYAGVTLANSKHPSNTSTIDYLNRYWTVNQSGISDFSCDVSFQYLPSDVNGNESSIWCGKYSGGSWILLAAANSGTHQLTGTVTGFSAFTGGQEGVLPVTLTSLTSTVTGRNIKLNWTTAIEFNNSGFEVERKTSNGIWNKVGFVSGKGTVNSPTNYSFEDRFLNTGKYSYRLKQIDFNGNFEYHNLNGEVEVGVPTKYDLSQNYPNPFNPVTKINFELPFDSKVKMIIYDVTGREIKTIVNEIRTAGYHTIVYDGSMISSGIYFYRIIANANGKDYISTKKMALIK